MKKFLSLVLALVMTMSLVTIGAGATDFTDDDDITYVEAVEVMTAVGVVSGYADGSFNPTAGLTRGAAAKIICNMILGPTTAAALNADSAPYKDVPVDNTFAGYIAFCAKEGLISGYADGTFRPAAPLTGYAFMKMLLGALGYDQNKEGYVGANWSINVAKQAIGIGLDKGLVDAFVGSKALTREEACLYAFNTLKATMVEYGNETTVVVGDVTIETSGKASEVKTNSNVDFMKKDDKSTVEFAERYFKNLKTTTKVGGDQDDFGRPATTWTVKSEKVGTYNLTPDLTYTVAVKGKDIYADLGKPTMASGNKATVYTDGKADAATSEFVLKENNDKIGAQGTVTEVYTADAVANGKDVIAVTVVVVNNYADTVAKVVPAKGDAKRYVTVTGLNSYGSLTNKFETKEFDVDDVVVMTIADGKIKSMDKLEQAQANVELTYANWTKGTIKTDTQYDVAYGYVNNAANVEDKIDVYVDIYGNAIYMVESEANVNYALVYSIRTGSGVTAVDGTSTFEATLILADGTKVANVTCEAETNQDESYYRGAENNGVVQGVMGCLVSYTVDDDGVYNLTKHNTDLGPVDLKKNQAKLTTNVYATEETVFFIHDNADATKVSVVVGYKSISDMTGANIQAVMEGKYAKAVTVWGGYVDTTAASDMLFISPDSAQLIKDKTNGAYYLFEAVQNKEITTVKIAADEMDAALADSIVWKNLHFSKGVFLPGSSDPAVWGEFADEPQDGEDFYVEAVTSAWNAKKSVIVTDNHAMGFGVTDKVACFEIDEDGVITETTIESYHIDDILLFVLDEDLVNIDLVIKVGEVQPEA